MAIHFFVNFDIFKWLYLPYYSIGSIYTKLGDFVKLGLHFMIIKLRAHRKILLSGNAKNIPLNPNVRQERAAEIEPT